MDSRCSWEKTVHQIASALDNANIQYHVDASSSLYFQGVEFEMDDLDLTVEWGKINNAHELFSLYSPSIVTLEYPPSFRFWVNSQEVHIMSYQGGTGIGKPQDRIKVNVGGCEIWCKTIAFYKESMTPTHRLWEPLQLFLKKSSS